MSTRRIVILGFMACGKTTVGQELARQLDCNFVDLDSFITERDGRSPAEIIEQDGEPRFRELESLALSEVLQKRDVRVVALGGGTWTIPANRTLIALHDCQSVWLDVPFEICWQRITVGGKSTRPLAENQDSAQALYESRCAIYELAQMQVDASAGKRLDEIATEIITLCASPIGGNPPPN